MSNIVIAIPTYKRPKMLYNLILSVHNCDFDQTLIDDVRIIVVDNDAEKSAKELIAASENEFNDKFKLHYYNYPVKGLANVRNELLKKSLALRPDFIVFVDDDEFVSNQWLNELVRSIENNKADAARGPVIAKLQNENLSPALLKLFERESHVDNAPLNRWTTGNLIIRRSSIEKFNVWFDTRFNAIGSEDTYFGTQMDKKGALIVWASKALVYESIPEMRTKIRWFINRTYRGASMFTYILKLEKNYYKLIKKMLVSISYVFIGLLTIPFIITPLKIRYSGLLKLIEGVGGVAGLFNLHYKEYQ